MDIVTTCLCCLRCPAERDMERPYIYFGKTEIYSDMLKECFEIHLTKLLSDEEPRICDPCVGRLRDAYRFKLQVLQSQTELQSVLDNERNTPDMEHIVKEDTSSLKSELSDMDEELIHYTEDAKSEIEIDPISDAEMSLQMFETINKDHLTSDIKPEPNFEVALEPYLNSETSPKLAPHKCSICDDRFANKSLLLKHKQIHKTCTKCNKQFKLLSRFKLHLTRCRQNTFVCDLCKKIFHRNSDFQRHKLVHFCANPFKCHECDKRFNDISDLNTHSNTHARATYTCDVCQRNFIRKHLLISHIGRHIGQRNFSCEICSNKFWESKALYMHTKCHTTTDKLYKCECGKSFRFKHGLVKHMHSHTESCCNVCGAKFSARSSLRQHESIHTNSRPYSCELCQKSFRLKSCLEIHRVVHTGEKSYCCETCGKWFSQERNLKTHLQTHAKGRFSCEVCPKWYATKESLRQHRRSHRHKRALSAKKQKNKKKS